MVITHPFHPLRGRPFALLKTRKSSGTLVLVLEGTERGTFTVPLGWTDRAPPSPVLSSPSRLDPLALIELADLVEQVAKKGLAS